MRTALRDNNPVIFLDHKSLFAVKGDAPDGDEIIPFGQARVWREGKNLTVVAVSLMVHRALEALDTLPQVSADVIDPRTLVPLDLETIFASVRKTGRLLIVDEAFAPFGLGAEVAARVADAGFDDLDAPIRRLNGLHTPTPYSPPLEAAVVPNVEAIVQAVRDLVAE